MFRVLQLMLYRAKVRILGVPYKQIARALSRSFQLRTPDVSR